MRKSLLFLVLILAASAAFGQATLSTPASAPAALPASIEMPSNPKEYLQKAAQLNGLTGPDIKPWHLKATFEVYDDAGKINGTGTYEELWVSEKKYKQISSYEGFTWTTYRRVPHFSRFEKWESMNPDSVR